MDEGGAEQAAIVVTEACTNLLKHASGGQILLQTTTEESDGAPLAGTPGPGSRTRDEQPGTVPAGRLQHRTSGQGLGAIERLSKQSDIYTAPGKARRSWRAGGSRGMAGSHVSARRIGAVNVSKPGEEVCGDAWGCGRTGDDLTDYGGRWIGARPGSQLASTEAVRQLYEHPRSAAQGVADAVHQRCAVRAARPSPSPRSTADRGKLTFAGLGNISARIFAGSEAGRTGFDERHGRPSMRADSGVQLSLARRRAAGSAFRRSFHRPLDWNPIRAWLRAIRR